VCRLSEQAGKVSFSQIIPIWQTVQVCPVFIQSVGAMVIFLLSGAGTVFVANRFP